MELDNPRLMMQQYAEKQFDFSVALKLLKNGYRVCRRGWNGTGMWVFYQKGYPDGIPINKNTADATGIEEGIVCKFMPYLSMKIAGPEAAFVHWVPSMLDILAEDYVLVS